MIRIAAFALVALAVAGCGQPATPGLTVTVYWEFERHTYIDGVDDIVPYDPDVNWPVGTGNRSCPQSGVDYVTVTDLNGFTLTPNVPCVNQSVQGVLVPGVVGNNTYVVTGWRVNQLLPLYQGQVTVTVPEGATTLPYGTAFAAGIPSALTVTAFLADPAAPAGYPTCGLAGIDEFQGWVEDSLGTLVWRSPVSCGVSDTPGISFGPVDRDVLFLWMDAIDNRVSPPDIHWSRCGYAQPNGFNHVVSGEDFFSLTLPLGACVNPPPPTP